MIAPLGYNHVRRLADTLLFELQLLLWRESCEMGCDPPGQEFT